MEKGANDMVDIMNRTVEEMLDFSKHSDNDLLGYYQQFHNGSAVAEAVSKELMKRGYEPKVIPFNQAGGRRSYEPAVYKGKERVP